MNFLFFLNSALAKLPGHAWSGQQRLSIAQGYRQDISNERAASYGPSKTRLGFYLPALAAGGMERVTLVLAEALVRRGFDVDIVLEHSEGGYFDRVPDGVRRIVLARRMKWRAYARLARSLPREGIAQLVRRLIAEDRYVPLGRLNSLIEYLEQEKPSVVFAAHGRIPHLALWARRIAAFKPRIAIIEHSTYSRWLRIFQSNHLEHAQLAYRLSLMRRFYGQADAIVGVSDGVADDLAIIAGLPRDRIATIHNPVVTDDLAALAKEPVAHPWFDDDSVPVIVAAGRLVQEKDFATLIVALGRLIAGGTPARLLILGEGEQRKRLLELARQLGVAENLDLPGWIENPYAYLSRANLFVLSSLFEGLPVALIEALACGCPVVSTDCPSGPREILDSGRYGMLTPVGDAAALAAAIEETLKNPLPRDVLQARGGYFSVERAAETYQRLIEALIQPLN